MRHIFLRWLAGSSALGLALVVALGLAGAATRPRYGGTLRVEVRNPGDSPDPPHVGFGMPDLNGGFSVVRWDAGRTAVYEASETAPGGRPYLDRVEVQLARPQREAATDLDLAKADVVELGPSELRRPAAARKVWSSAPVRVVVLAFGPHVEDARVREALSLAVDRGAIHRVLLQQQGEISGALLPQWLTGYAFLFPATADIARARTLVASLPATSRALTLGADDPALRSMAERIALNARDAGLAVTVRNGASDAWLTEVRVASADPARALGVVAAALGVSPPAHAASPEALCAAERAVLEGFRVVPLFHLPEVYGVSPKVKGGPGVSPLGEWRFENLWLEGGRP